MAFGTNLLEWFQAEAQSLVIIAIIVIGVVLAFKREFTKLIGFAIIAVVVVLLVFNPWGVQEVLLELGNKIIGAASTTQTNIIAVDFTRGAVLHSGIGIAA